MEGEWNEVKAKPKKKKQNNNTQNQTQYGGKGTGGKLIAGPVKKSGGGGGGNQYGQLNNQASTIAEFDYHIDDGMYDEVKYELVSHKCAQAVSEARLHAGLTQTQLAQKIGEKTTTIVDIENATAKYNAGVINEIEKTLGVKIPRGRKK